MNDDDFDMLKYFAKLELEMLKDQLADLNEIDDITADGYAHIERQDRWPLARIGDLLEATTARRAFRGREWWREAPEGA